MLDLVTIFTKGGIVLWSKRSGQSPGVEQDPVNATIRDFILQDRAVNTCKYSVENYALQWVINYEHDLVFMVVWPKVLQLTYIDELLKELQEEFCASHEDELRLLQLDESEEAATRQLPEFDKFSLKFDAILHKLENEAFSSESSRVKNTSNASNTDASDETTTMAPNADSLKKTSGKKAMQANDKKGSKNSTTPVSTKKGKKMRVWDGKVSAEDAAALDYSGGNENVQPDDDDNLDHLVDEDAIGTITRDGLYDAAELEYKPSTSNTVDASESKSKPTQNKSFSSWFSSLTSRTLTLADLAPLTSKMRDHLINKNVAPTIATQLVQGVEKKLVGQRLSSFSSVQSTINAAVEEILQRILTPRTSTDLLRDILSKRQKRNQVFSIVFVGVNGVGKSTNLSKVCFWLLQNRLRVLVAACDTFRSGAVEQLRVHVRNLKRLNTQLSGHVDKEGEESIALFERGYGKDSAGIAKDAISYAQANNFDVVLVDTAGRMQDNEPLMRALAKLVTTNDPDRILFVGEALVGNEAVDQLTKFNQALRDFSGRTDPRQIDGIVLTKFDTIDDKVGAALSMTYITGQPILFVGTGQTYTDLRKMNVKTIVSSLVG